MRPLGTLLREGISGRTLAIAMPIDAGAGSAAIYPPCDDLLDLSVVEVEQDGRRAILRTAPRPSIDPICHAIGRTLPPIFQEMPTAQNTQDPA